MERDRKHLVRMKRLKSILLKTVVFLFILGLAVLAFAVAGSTR